MNKYDQTFDPNILIGQCDLISRFNDFALYLDTQLVYFHTSFYDQTFDPNILIGHCDLISCSKLKGSLTRVTDEA